MALLLAQVMIYVGFSFYEFMPGTQQQQQRTPQEMIDDNIIQVSLFAHPFLGHHHYANSSLQLRAVQTYEVEGGFAE